MRLHVTGKNAKETESRTKVPKLQTQLTIMKGIFLLLLSITAGCGNSSSEATTIENKSPATKTTATVEAKKIQRFAGAFSNGMKGDSIFFDVSADGKKLENLTFKGYWRCSGRLEQTTVGPDGAFTITAGKVKDHITEPPNGGSTAWRFELEANLEPTKATGTFRMNINNLGCDTYKLNWTAVAR
jgi:hypothetical protein